MPFIMDAGFSCHLYEIFSCLVLFLYGQARFCPHGVYGGRTGKYFFIGTGSWGMCVPFGIVRRLFLETRAHEQLFYRSIGVPGKA